MLATVPRRRRPAAALLCGLLPACAGVLAAPSAASAANVCYKALDVDSGASLFFARLQTRSAGTLVPENEAGAVGPAQTLFEVDGKFTRRTGLVANGRPLAEMSLATGTILVVAGQGAQMSLLRNFGRGAVGGGSFGFSVLDCGSSGASSAPSTPSAPASWTCRGVTAVEPDDVAIARALRLVKVTDLALEPRCRDFRLLPG